jgi:flavin-dependent dehydrogenase
MRIAAPLILGAGPAGCAAAITLARAGVRPLLLDRSAEAGDALCGGFLSWRTAQQLEALGVSPQALGAHRVTRLALVARHPTAYARLLAPAWGLSRRTMDNALRQVALAAGAEFAVDTIRTVEGATAIGQRKWSSGSLFLATGKHDLRGHNRPRCAADPAVGLRLRLPADAALTALASGTIELHLFDGGYAGLVLQDGGSANLCLAVRKSLLTAAGGDPKTLLADLAGSHPHFAARLRPGWETLHIDGIGAVPYGWIARATTPGLFRLGDQAAVIPSLAGEGMGLALASGVLAADRWLAGHAAAAPAFQRQFARMARRPLAVAALARSAAEKPALQPLALVVASHVPALTQLLMACTRVHLPARPCAPPMPC